MKKVYLMLCFLCLGAGAFSQTTVFTDPFTTSTGATYTVAAGAIGTSTTWSLSRSGADWGARIDGGILDVTNDGSATANAAGWAFASTPTTSFSAPYNPQLNLNSGVVTWTFNIRVNRANLAGFTAGSYGLAFILAGSSTTANNTGNGYALVLGNTGATDPFRLAKYTGGLVSLGVVAPPSANDIIVSNTTGFTNIGTNYYSVKVTYTPATNTWELFLRDDGTTAFADPATGVLTSQGTAVDATYTGTSLGFLGGYWQGSTTATQTAFFDNVTVTVPAAGTPTVNVSPVSLSGFTSLASPAFSAEQSYTVDGSNLTANISIAPPAGYQISTGTGGAFVPTNPIVLTQTGGVVASTPIYVRLNSATLGVNAGNITHTSAGSNNPNVAVTGKVLAAEPTTQGVITISNVTNSTMDVSFTAGDGAKQLLVIHAATAVVNDPVDGTTYAANTGYGLGSNLGGNTYVLYNGVSGNGGAPVTVTGLTIGTTYHFALYSFNDGGVGNAENYLLPPATGNATTLTAANIYTWTGLNGTLWTDPLNWLPVRLTPATNDSLLFETAGFETVTNVPTQTVGYIGVTFGTIVNLQAGAANNVLTVGNSTGTDLYVEGGSALNISTANALIINMVTGATAVIDGDMTFTAGAHKFTAADASGITFNNGSSFTAGTGFSGNAFGAGTANSVIFTNGSTYIQVAGSNPFSIAQPLSIVVFQTGSLFRMDGNLAPSLSGRTYADLEINNAGFSQSGTGGGALSIDNLTITQGVLLGLNTTGGVSIKGNISTVAGSTLNFLAASANTVSFNGTSGAQTIDIGAGGTLGWSATESLTINNAAGVNVNRDISLGAGTTFTLTNGILKFNAPGSTVSLTATTTLAGTPSNTTFVDGKVKKTGNTNFVFPVGKTGFGYVPISITNFAGTNAVTDAFTAEYVRGNARLLGPVTAVGLDHVSGCDYWTLNLNNGTPTVDVTCNWSANNICNGAYVDNLSELVIAHFDGTNWDSFGGLGTATGAPAAGNITWPAVTTFSPFSLGSITFNNPLPITINYFTGTKQNGNHLLNWKVTCTNTPTATMALERSSDGRTFTSVYSVTATALQCQQPFSHTDVNPVAGVNYYRLKMTDANGKVSYSNIVSLINASKGFDIRGIAPNPIVAGRFNLQVSAAQAANMNIVITDMQGRVLQRQSASLTAGFNEVPVNVRNLAAGTYQVAVYTADGRAGVQRFVVQ